MFCMLIAVLLLGETGLADSKDEVVRTSPLTTSGIRSRLSQIDRDLDPRYDGWKSEAFSEAVEAQLEILGKLLASPKDLGPDQLSDLVAGNFTCGSLRPRTLELAFQGKSLTVQRSAPGWVSKEAQHQGTVEFVQMLRALIKPLSDAKNVRASFKVNKVVLTDQGAKTNVHLQLSGRRPTENWQIDTNWRCQWRAEVAESPPQLDSVTALNFEQVVAHVSQGSLFADCTTAVLGQNQSFHDQLVYGLNHWARRIHIAHEIGMFYRNGIAVGDINGDDLDDLYVCQPGGLPNRLYLQNTDGTATDVSQFANVDWLNQTISALFVDLDNDGDQDLVLAMLKRVVLMANDGTGRFEPREVLAAANVDLHSLSAADYDNDGDLDLYACVAFGDLRNRGPTDRFVYHDATDGGANVLFRNDTSTAANHQWQFTDVTALAGLDVDNRRHSLAASWDDYDNDGDQDLYVANDYGPNSLYRNDGGKFIDVAREAGVIDYGAGMSVSWADYNRDGLMDLYVGNMFSSAGRRVTNQRKFRPGANDQMRSIYTRFAKGNSLFENIGGGKFREVGSEAAVETGRWAWSSVFWDLNNDGWEDLLVANGFITTQDTGDL